MSSNKNDKELNIVKLVANMAEEKYTNKRIKEIIELQKGHYYLPF